MQFSIIVLFVISVGFGVGWVKNLIKLTNCDFEAPYKAEVIHTIGIIPIVGGVTGWMDFGK
jgi:hypothetical protein